MHCHRNHGVEVMPQNNLTGKQAYRAMFHFLEVEYELMKSGDLAVLLSSMDWRTWNHGMPGDPAVWPQWLEAVKLAQAYNNLLANEVVSTANVGKLTPEEAFRAMFYFLEIEDAMVKTEDVGAILRSMSPYIVVEGRPADSKIWPKWHEAMIHARLSDDRLSV